VNTTTDAEAFQKKIKMPFQRKKCHAINFGRMNSPYLITDCMGRKNGYIGATFQSSLRFDQHIDEKCTKSQKVLVGIKQALDAWCPKGG